MDENDPLDEMEQRMKKSLKVIKEELAKIHVGRANPAMIEDIEVDYYGSSTPLNQIANISAPDPGLLAVQPYDDSQIDAIEKAIMNSDLGLNPNDDGTVVRIPIPKLSGERREELVDLIREMGEETKISLRNIRRETNKEVEELEDEGEITEDDKFMLEDEIDDITSEYTEKVDQLLEGKEQEVRAV